MSELKVSEDLFKDSYSLNYHQFQIIHRSSFRYIYDSRYLYSDWDIFDCRKICPGEMNLLFIFNLSPIKGLKKNKINILRTRSYIRRLMCPNTTPDEIFWNLIEDTNENSRFQMMDSKDLRTRDLRPIAEEVFKHELGWIETAYSEQIEQLELNFKSNHTGTKWCRSKNSKSMLRASDVKEVREYLIAHPEIGILSYKEIAEKLNESGAFDIVFNSRWFNNHNEAWTKEDRWNARESLGMTGASRTTQWRQKKSQPEEKTEEITYEQPVVNNPFDFAPPSFNLQFPQSPGESLNDSEKRWRDSQNTLGNNIEVE